MYSLSTWMPFVWLRNWFFKLFSNNWWPVASILDSTTLETSLFAFSHLYLLYIWNRLLCMAWGKCQNTFCLYKYPMAKAHFFFPIRQFFLTSAELPFLIKQRTLLGGFFYRFSILFLLTFAALCIISKDFTKINLMIVSILKSQFSPQHVPFCHISDWFKHFITSF